MTSPQNSKFLTTLPPLVTSRHLCLYNPLEVTSPLVPPQLPPSPCKLNDFQWRICDYSPIRFCFQIIFWSHFPNHFSTLKWGKFQNSDIDLLLILSWEELHLTFGVTSPLLKIGSLPLSPHVTFWGYPPPSPFGVTSFMDGPLLVP